MCHCAFTDFRGFARDSHDFAKFLVIVPRVDELQNLGGSLRIRLDKTTAIEAQCFGSENEIEAERCDVYMCTFLYM